MQHTEYFSKITSGEIGWSKSDRKELAKLEDDLYRIRITKFKRTRTKLQNALYWKRNTILAEGIGVPTKESMHLILLEDCGYINKIEVAGLEHLIYMSSKDLSTNEFSELMKRQTEIAQFMNEGRDVELYIRLPAGMDEDGKYITEEPFGE